MFRLVVKATARMRSLTERSLHLGSTFVPFKWAVQQSRGFSPSGQPFVEDRAIKSIRQDSRMFVDKTREIAVLLEDMDQFKFIRPPWLGCFKTCAKRTGWICSREQNS